MGITLKIVAGCYGALGPGDLIENASEYLEQSLEGVAVRVDTPPPKVEEVPDFDAKTVAELLEMAKAAGIEGVNTKTTKAQLIEALTNGGDSGGSNSTNGD